MTPYHALSNGQRFRADLARALVSSDYVVYDEFTSVVDRDVARTAAYAVSKDVRRRASQKFVAVSCHADIVEWLEPDWVFDTALGELRRGKLRRPPMRLRLYRGDAQAWRIFSRHHYLTASLNPCARIYLAYMGERLVGFDAYLPMFGHAGNWQQHRSVILPDFQGAGLGMRMQEEACELLIAEKHCCVFGITSPRWNLSRKARRKGASTGNLRDIQHATARLTCSWLYVPRASTARDAPSSGAAR
jgi:hypothetical protein